MKKTLAMLLALLMLLSLCACGIGNKSASDQTIKKDLLNALSEGIESDEKGYRQTAQLSPLYTYELSEFEIEKRQTALENRTDKVYVNASYTSTDGVIQYTGSFVLDYELYNEGWLLENITFDSFDYQALQDVEFTTEEIAIALANYGYENATDIQVTNRSVELEYNVIHYDVTATCTYPYVTEKINVEISFNFMPDGWHSPYNYYVIPQAEPELDWHIDGEFRRPDDDHMTYHISVNGPIESLSMSKCWTGHDYYDGNLIYDYDEYQGDDFDFYRIPNTSLKTIIVDSGWDIWDLIADSNFSVELRGSITNADFYDYKYAVDGCNLIFFGRDKLGQIVDYEDDEYNRRMLYDTVELVPVD